MTVIDDHSRFKIVLKASSRATISVVQAELEQVFHSYGLPSRLTTDNGAPLGSPSAPGKLTELAVWLIRPGARVSYSRPHDTPTNCKDERFHPTLKAEVRQRHAFTTHEHAHRWRQASFIPVLKGGRCTRESVSLLETL
ncbi:DDE-type integrase/transposase/recombinase [Paraburkholderia sp. J67]|uniref:DDE-type integrase/transposase/recombinase n=1 Tax=Paraburkholderia sp. J67 TaxID=2805435 RepID=UPI0039F607C9